MFRLKFARPALYGGKAVHVLARIESARRTYRLGLVVLGTLLLAMTSCNSPYRSAQEGDANLDLGWPKGLEPWSETASPGAIVRQPGEGQFLQPVPRAEIPRIPDAEEVSMDEFCGTCHETYFKAFANNVHREKGCENCHGGGSLHLETRGKEPNTILSFRRPEQGTQSGRLMGPAERSAVCLQCHDGDEANLTRSHLSVPSWETSAHAHEGIVCTDCHRNHYNVPLGTPPVDEMVTLGPGGQPPVARPFSSEVIRFQGPNGESSDSVSSGGTSGKLGARSPDVCYSCHEDKRRMEEFVHPHQIGVPLDFECTACHDPPPRGLPHLVEGHPTEFDCTTCHDVHGNILPETRKDLCLKCHGGAHIGQWETSIHNAANVACTDCHNPHSKTGPPMTVDQPQTCYRCHSDKRELEQIAHPHQVNGPNGFICTTCHDPHDIRSRPR